MQEIQNDINGFTGKLKSRSGDVESLIQKASVAAAGFFSIQAASGFLKEMVKVRGEFQQIEVTYKTMLGSKEKADQLMAESVKLQPSLRSHLGCSIRIKAAVSLRVHC